MLRLETDIVRKRKKAIITHRCHFSHCWFAALTSFQLNVFFAWSPFPSKNHVRRITVWTSSIEQILFLLGLTLDGLSNTWIIRKFHFPACSVSWSSSLFFCGGSLDRRCHRLKIDHDSTTTVQVWMTEGAPVAWNDGMPAHYRLSCQ